MEKTEHEFAVVKRNVNIPPVAEHLTEKET
jgi:hypothetical protein